MEIRDLTNEEGWRNYLACHPHAREIIGEGVAGFDARFLNALEPNRDKLNLPGNFGQHRFDFVVHRVDGTAVRLHPSEKFDGKVIIGSLAAWEFGARAPTPGQASTPSLTGAIDRTHGHVDVFSAERAHRMIMDIFHRRTGAPSELAVDLLTGDFPWDTFLMGREFGRDLMQEGITSMHLVCNEEEEPVIDVFTRADPFSRRRISIQGSRAILA